MQRHLAISLCTLVLGLLVGTSAAWAGPLLSGYGGPGDGSQVVLGEELLNGPRSGGGGGAAAGGGEVSLEAPAATQPSRSVAPAPPGNEGEAGHTRTGQRRAAGTRVRSRHGAPGSGSSRRHAPAPVPAPERTGVATGTSLLGLSGADLLYVLLALAGLAVVAVLTRHAAVVSAGAREDAALKGRSG